MRKADHKINDMFIKRWSPRAMSGRPISDEELSSLFEAARWAPSAYNEQPWRFIYAKRGSNHWNRLFDVLVEFNQMWCKNAAALVLIVSSKEFSHNSMPNVTHLFDAGAAWQSIALQGSMMGLVVHGMSGFDYAKARESMNVPENLDIVAMFAVGKPGRKEDLPVAMQEREEPSGRKKIAEFIFEGQHR